jgi:predicted patatin/cPLA2 family phospholipase
VDAITGNIVTFDETVDKNTFIKGLWGSTAVPFVFLPVPFEDKLLIDGGVAWNLDVASAVNKCRLLVNSDEKIHLDIIDVDRGASIMEQWDTSGNVISNYLRYKKLQDYFSRMDDEIEV